ncbi:PREDICTED: F-box protein FBW2-like [Fragaria vesca subsp. vesca]|uniref:F-box protein FBW2-like n=1 Tax=Fragaria vesca subsp. vesca TaxID=101020 RepID=UPI0002C35B0D|nr:PREDICTED: F-box protein FBW2-like [Fragaria vesca subsp. vesca]XP_011464602.1 PREDICTED: F-box protein FBW2-like [Fragaria vesca subsp. vesca]
MEMASDVRRWDELIPEALSLIFNGLSFKEKLTVIPMVCKPWSKVVMGSDCWREIDIEEWSNGCQSQHLDRMIQMLVARSGGSMRKLCVPELQNDMIFSFIAEHANALQTLRLRRSEISDSVVEQTIGRFSNITFLDLSYCGKIGSRSLKAIGMNCKLLTGLCRNIHPSYSAGILMNDEADAIATTMPRLKHLEIAYHIINTQGALQILESCPELEFMDLRGCWDVKLDDKFFGEKFPKLNVLGPSVDDCYDEDLEGCLCNSDASDECSPFEYEDLSEEHLSDEYLSDR